MLLGGEKMELDASNLIFKMFFPIGIVELVQTGVIEESKKDKRTDTRNIVATLISPRERKIVCKLENDKVSFYVLTKGGCREKIDDNSNHRPIFKTKEMLEKYMMKLFILSYKVPMI